MSNSRWARTFLATASTAAVSTATAVAAVAAATAITTSPAQAATSTTVTSTTGTAPVSPPALLPVMSCVSADNCMAVGTTSAAPGGHVAAARWNGTRWQRTPVPNPPDSAASNLVSVDCPSAAMCMAVGEETESATGYNVPVAMIWDGTTWTQSKPLNWGSSRTTLVSVSCPSSSECFTAGSATPGNGKPDVPLAEKWSGGDRWTELTTTSSPKWSGSAFDGIDCATTTSCVAVGTYEQAGKNYTLIETNDGMSLSYHDISASQAPVPGRLTTIDCVAADNCVAVGDRDDGKPLVERSDGDTANAWMVSATVR